MRFTLDWRTCGKRVIGGLDHLGVSNFSIALYGKLLPGVTNVTDRARYYSFYPWVIHEYASRARSDDRKQWLSWFRRLDFAYAVASIAADLRGKGDARAVVGASLARKTLQDAEDNQIISLEAADLASDGTVPKGAYFKRLEGGLGQYYKAVLRDLGLLVSDEEHSYPDIQLSTYAGKPLAESVSQQPAFHRLAEIALNGSATVADLAAVGEKVGPSSIDPDSEEHQQLCGMFWGEDDSLCRSQSAASRICRRNTLLALLAFAEATTPATDDVVELFRIASAQHRLEPAPWAQRKPDVDAFLYGWADYQWNEYVNYALESLLWAVIQLVGEQPSQANYLATTLTDMALSHTPATDLSVKGFIQRCATIRDKNGEESELLTAASLKQSIRQSIRHKEVETTVRLAVSLLSHLITATDPSSETLFQTIPGAQELIQSHRIHLLSWRSRVSAASSQDIASFLNQFFTEWVINRHLIVATRKLASQGVQTYKFAPDDRVLICLTTEEVPPGPTNPRLRQGLQMLQDLDYIEDVDGLLNVTKRGTSKLQESE